jgi:hypothetical protein
MSDTVAAGSRLGKSATLPERPVSDLSARPGEARAGCYDQPNIQDALRAQSD